MPAAMTDDGTSISYEAAGVGPPNLLCMHGWGGSGRYFDATLEHLDLTRLRAVTLDLRGHRHSDPAGDGYTLDRIAADALAVADAAGLDGFVVLGFSMSAKFGQYLALTVPERVTGLILVAGCPAGEIPLPAELTEDWLGREGDAGRMAELATSYASNPIEPALLERFGQDAATVRRAALEGTLSAATATSFADRVGSIATPTLVVGGRHDAMFTPDLLREAVVAPLPAARLALLDAGHEIAIELPPQLSALIEAFLAGLHASADETLTSSRAHASRSPDDRRPSGRWGDPTAGPTARACRMHPPHAQWEAHTRWPSDRSSRTRCVVGPVSEPGAGSVTPVMAIADRKADHLRIAAEAGVEHARGHRARRACACATGRCPSATSTRSRSTPTLLGRRARGAAAHLGDDRRHRRGGDGQPPAAATRPPSTGSRSCWARAARCSTIPALLRTYRPDGGERPPLLLANLGAAPGPRRARAGAGRAARRAARRRRALHPPQPAPGGGPARGRARLRRASLDGIAAAVERLAPLPVVVKEVGFGLGRRRRRGAARRRGRGGRRRGRGRHQLGAHRGPRDERAGGARRRLRRLGRRRPPTRSPRRAPPRPGCR